LIQRISSVHASLCRTSFFLIILYSEYNLVLVLLFSIINLDVMLSLLKLGKPNSREGKGTEPKGLHVYVSLERYMSSPKFF